MRKRHFITIIALFLTTVLPSSVYAIPDGDRGIYISKRFWQWQSPWGDDYYAGKPTKPFKDHGCLVTSFAMLYNYYGLSVIPNENYEPKFNPLCNNPAYQSYCQFWGLFIRTDPGTLNEWFTTHNVYVHDDKTGDDNLYPMSAVKRFYVRYPTGGVTASVAPQDSCQPESDAKSCAQIPWSDPKTEKLLDYDIEQKKPGIMKINWRDENGDSHDSHFVLIGGYSTEDNSYRAYDPNQPYSVVLNYPPGLNKLYSDPTGIKSHTNLRVDRYKEDYLVYPYRPNQSYLLIGGYSPIEMQVISPDGKVTGFDLTTGIQVADIPRAYYTEESESTINSNVLQHEPVKVLFINEPSTGNYILKLFGTGEGPYTIKIQGMKEDGAVNIDTSFTGTATPSLSETYRVSYSPTGEATLTNMADSNQAPIANAGANQTGEQSYEIKLDGSASNDPDGDPLKYAWSVISRPSGSTATISDVNAVSPTFIPDMAGLYVLQLVVNDHWTDSSPAYVTVTATPVQSRISVTPNYSKPLSAGSTILSFTLNNIGRIGVSNGTLNINLADPDGNTVYTGTQTFSITVGQTKTVDVPLNIPSLKFGNYTLTYTQSDETHTGSPTTTTIANSALASFSFDKSSYRVRDMANLTLTLMNTGKFNLDTVTVSVTATDANYTNTRTVSISPSPLPSPAGGEGGSGGSPQGGGVLVYAIPIPDTILAGNHDMSATLSLESGKFCGKHSFIFKCNAYCIIAILAYH